MSVLQPVCEPFEVQALVVAEDASKMVESVQQSRIAETAGESGGGIVTAVVGPISARLTMKQVVRLLHGGHMMDCFHKDHGRRTALERSSNASCCSRISIIACFLIWLAQRRDDLVACGEAFSRTIAEVAFVTLRQGCEYGFVLIHGIWPSGGRSHGGGAWHLC